MKLQRVFWFGFPHCRFIDLSVTRPAKLFKGDRTLVAENNIVECVSSVDHSVGEFQPVCFVCSANHLAVPGVLKSPALLSAVSLDCRGMDQYTTLGKPFLDLAAGCFIIFSYLSFDEGFTGLIQLSGVT